MARDHYEDEDEDRPRRKSRSEPETRKSNVGVILGIVAGVVLLIVVGCGVAGYFMFRGLETNREDFRASAKASEAGLEFIEALGTNELENAYSTRTTARFRTANPLPAFQAMIATYPAFQNQVTRIDNDWKLRPTGSVPNRVHSPVFRVVGSSMPGQTKQVNVQMTLTEGPGDVWKIDSLVISP
jgi:cytoskeletal protein RodZ